MVPKSRALGRYPLSALKAEPVLAHPFAPAFLGLGSLAKTIVNDVAGGLFSALAKALMPQAVSNDVLKFLGWLVSLPNLASGSATAPLEDVTTGYGDITILVREITWLAYGLIPVAVSVNALRFLQGTFHRGSQADGFVKVAVAIGGLAIWAPALRLGITLFNSVTIGVLNLPVVQTDFRNVMGVLTGATAAYGGLGAVGGLLMIVLDLIVISMIVLKVAMTAVLGILFVAAPIGIALWPIPELSKIVQLIGTVLFGILMVPLLWVITFATAGAFTGGILNHPGPVGKEFMSVCAGVLCFALAIAVPKFVLGRITMIAAASGGVRGMLTGGGGGGTAHRSGSRATALERMSHMRTGLLEAGISGSRGVGHALSSFGAAGAAAGFGLKGLKDSGHLGQLHSPARTAVGSTAVGKAARATGRGLADKWGALNQWATASSSRSAGAARVGMAMPEALGTAYATTQPSKSRPGTTRGAATPTSSSDRNRDSRATATTEPRSATSAAPKPPQDSAGARSRAAAAAAAAGSGRAQQAPTGWRAAEPIYDAALKGKTTQTSEPPSQPQRRVFVADPTGRVDTPQPRTGKSQPSRQSPREQTQPGTGHEQMRRVTWSFRNRNTKN